jgi:3'-phosphoadenosine 5'-phosphosulfate sulfotransferase (PAPS reductase)/FAD synthetase
MSAELAKQILLGAIDEHKPSRVFGLLSGGHDSLTVTHFASSIVNLDAIVHIDTGIGIPETQQFVKDVCAQYNWPLQIYRAVDCGQVYEDLVMAHGFPGADHHTKMFNRLKERPLRALLRDNPGGNVLFISGLRRLESGRRMRLRNEPVQKDGRRVWVAPFFNWSNDEVRDYHEQNGLPTNPVKQYLCMSGECLCGAYAKPNELKEIEGWFPHVGARIRSLEEKVRAAGFPWGWDEQPPAWWSKRKLAQKHGQEDAFDDEAVSAIQMLCTSCESRHEQAGDIQVRRVV